MRTKIAILPLILIAFLFGGTAPAQAGEGDLFWYTDLGAAKAAARAAGKPILSLRLPAGLDEGSANADGRFFRTVLYRDPAIHQILHDRYILHWRPVPSLPRAAGGSTSLQYILDRRGRLLEPLPGLYGPAAFRAALEEGARAEASTAAHLDDEQLASWTVGRRNSELALAAEALERDLRAADPHLQDAGGHLHLKVFQAAPGTLADWLLPDTLDTQGEDEVTLVATEPQLHRLAELSRPQIHLDPASRASLLREKGVTDPRQAERLVDALESTLAFDEVIHRYRTGPAILKALNDPQRRDRLDLEAFDDWVYKNVFNPPFAAPSLSLAQAGIYSYLPALTRRVSRNGC